MFRPNFWQSNLRSPDNFPHSHRIQTPGIVFTAPHTGILRVTTRGLITADNGSNGCGGIRILEANSGTVIDQLIMAVPSTIGGLPITLEGY